MTMAKDDIQGHWEWQNASGEVYGVILQPAGLDWYCGRKDSRVITRKETLLDYRDRRVAPAGVPVEIATEIHSAVQGLLGPNGKRKAKSWIEHELEYHASYYCESIGGRHEVFRRWRWYQSMATEKGYWELTLDDEVLVLVECRKAGEKQETKTLSVSFQDFIERKVNLYLPVFASKWALNTIFERGYADRQNENEIRGRFYDVWLPASQSQGMGKLVQSWNLHNESNCQRDLLLYENYLSWDEESTSFLGNEYSESKSQSFEHFLRQGPIFGSHWLSKDLFSEVCRCILALRPDLQP